MKVHGPVIADSFTGFGLDVDDTVHTFGGADQLTFNPANFYLTESSTGTPIVNLHRGFKGASAVGVDLSLTSGVLAGLTFSGTTFDYGSWWSSGDPTKLTVPAGVNWVRITAIVNFQYTGTPNNTTANAIVLNKNDSTTFVVPPVWRHSVAVLASMTNAVEAGPVTIPVNAGDYFTVSVVSTWGGASAASILGPRSFLCIEAVPV